MGRAVIVHIEFREVVARQEGQVGEHVIDVCCRAQVLIHKEDQKDQAAEVLEPEGHVNPPEQEDRESIQIVHKHEHVHVVDVVVVHEVRHEESQDPDKYHQIEQIVILHVAVQSNQQREGFQPGPIVAPQESQVHRRLPRGHGPVSYPNFLMKNYCIVVRSHHEVVEVFVRGRQSHQSTILPLHGIVHGIVHPSL